jgi:2-oxoglutarate dehydrogenase complex, dehydrogenase (E1) component, and related enzymes
MIKIKKLLPSILSGSCLVQDEPANQGTFGHTWDCLAQVYGRQDHETVSRPASASHATGFAKTHQAEQKDLIRRAFEDEI